MSVLNKGVLVLNKHFIPCFITNMRHAFSLLFREVAFVVTEDFALFSIWDWMKQPVADGDESIGLVKGRMRIPRVISVDSEIKLSWIKPRLSKYAILIRDNLRCQYCGKKFPPHELTVDHVIPKSRYGKISWDNLVACCSDCNRRKGDRTPSEANMRLIREPKVPHFAIVSDITISDLIRDEWVKFLPK